MKAMEPILEIVHRGGPIMYAIMGLCVVLYARCFDLLLYLSTTRRKIALIPNATEENLLRIGRLRHEWQEHFIQQRHTLGAMIAAAPLLGLLGTVNGMITTFESLSSNGGNKSMEGLASGISEVLVATESGLAVAIPAVLIVYYAHRQTQKNLSHLNELGEQLRQKS